MVSHHGVKAFHDAGGWDSDTAGGDQLVSHHDRSVGSEWGVVRDTAEPRMGQNPMKMK